MKRICSLFAALALFCSCCLSASAAEPASTAPSSQPRVMVTDYQVIGIAAAGASFELSISLTNQSRTQDVKNLKISVNGGEALLARGVDAVFLDAIPRGETRSVRIALRAAETAPGGSHTLAIQTDYEDAAGQAYTATDHITIRLQAAPTLPEPTTRKTQPVLMLADYAVEGEIRQGVAFTLVLTFRNQSKTQALSNVKLSFSQESGALLPVKLGTAFVANIPAGGTYVWRLALKTATDAPGGACTLTFSCAYETPAGETCSSTDTLVLALPKAVEPAAVTQNASQPRLMMTSYEIEQGAISPDEQRELTVKLCNMSQTKAVRNVKLTLSDASGELRAEGTGTQFVPSIAPGASYTWALTISAVHSAATGEHDLTLTAEYEDDAQAAYTSNDTLRLPVRQIADLSFSGAALPVKVTQGETAVVTVNLMNTGKSALSNCIVEIDVPQLESGGSVLVGALAAGETKAGTVNLRVSKEALGETKGTITITCEDETGKRMTETVPVSTIIQEKLAVTQAAETKEKKYPLWWLFALLGLLLGGGVGAGVPIAVLSARQRRRDEAML
ncbi:MAG: hypothetical protein IJK64_12045 [Clostridia bacterium]|nr:hypothetical protein [Clostridia bacterium]